MFQELRSSLGLLAFLTLVTGVAYPLAMTALGQSLFPHEANGSLIEEEGRIRGSTLIGQSFSNPRYFHSRPSAAGTGYDAAQSSGSHLAPTSRKLLGRITDHVNLLRAEENMGPIPVDLVTASGSGLDPDISVAAAHFQATRIARLRSLSPAEIEKLIAENTTPRTFGFLGENRVNVLALNRALDRLSPSPPSPDAP